MNFLGVRKKTKSFALQAVGVLLITFLLAEGLLRLYNHFFPSFIFYSPSYNRFRGKPFASDWNFKLNSRGFKDLEFLEKQAQVYRMIAIGDSFAFGVVPYEHNFLTILESQANLTASRIEVLNMGIPSIGPREYLSLLVNEGLALKPDMVLISLFIGNDLTEIIKPMRYEYSLVTSLVHFMLNLRPKYQGRIIHRPVQYCDDCPNFDRASYLQMVFDRSAIFQGNREYLLEKINRALRSLEEIKKICHQRGVELVVVVIPDELQINKNLLTEVKRAYDPKDHLQFDLTLPNRLLSEKLAGLNINHIDLHDTFASSSQTLYRTQDSHWNIAGNQLAAKVIYENLQKYLNSEEK